MTHRWRVAFALALLPLMLGISVEQKSAGQGQSPAGSRTGAERPEPPFQTGFSVYVYGDHAEAEQRSAEILDRLASLHVNAVSLTFFLYQQDWTATEVFVDEEQTPSKEFLEQFVQQAHHRGMQVMLRPVLDEARLFEDGQWRGSIEPVDRDAWFRSYAAIIRDYAVLAHQANVEMFNIGTELTSMERDVDQWIELIRAVREVYAGAVTYSFNWEGGGMMPGNPAAGFTGELDFVGLDAYFPLDAPAGASVSQLVAAWQPWMEQVVQTQEAIGKEIVITEIGTRSQAGSYQTPWLWTEEAPVSQQDQANYFEAFCRIISAGVVGDTGASLVNRPGSDATIAWLPPGTEVTITGPAEMHAGSLWYPAEQAAAGEAGYLMAGSLQLTPPVSGTYIWAVDFNQGVAVPESDPGFAPLNKLAEPVIARCYELLASEAPVAQG